MTRSILASFVLLAVAGCSQNNTPPSPSSFDLPGDVSFGCVQRGAGGAATAFVPLVNCRVEDDANDPETHSLIAFVTQVATGEVAAVDLRADRSLDSDALVPGFTYQRVGEIPTGIVTIDPSATLPSITFVSSFGSRQLQAIDTARFHPDVEPTAGFVETGVDLPEGPTDVVFVPVTGEPTRLGYVFAPIPALGAVAQVAVNETGALESASLQLLAVDPDPLNALGPAVANELDPYERVCSRDYADATAGPVAIGSGPVASPVKLEVDLDSSPPVLLVADEASPVIHRFTVAAATGAAPLAGLAVGAPTTDLAVTPPVAGAVADDPLTSPASIDQRYVYAIDATDGSVLALDYTAGSPTFGAVLAVNVGPEPADRIAYREPARALEVITPELRMAVDPASDTPGICDPTDPDTDRASDASPAALRGAFLAVGLRSGLVGIVDIWDLEAPCRGGLGCTNPANADDIVVAIRRHRPRLATFVTEPPVVTGAPSLSFETNPGLLDETGFPTSGSGPGLAPIDCDDALSTFSVPGFPDDANAPALICLRDDPWAGLNQRWTAVFGGPIPLANGGDGLLTDAGGTLRLEAPNGRFCEVGVLGATDVVASALGPSDPELGYVGDQLEIIGDLPPATENDEACAAFDIPDDGSEEDREPIRFQILSASDDELVLGPLGDTIPAAVLPCFPNPTAYRVRTRGAYTVIPSGERVRHRVASIGGACRVDTASFPVVVGDPDTYRNFRAIPGRTFIHPLVAFQITLAGEDRTEPLGLDQESQLVFDVGQYPAKLAVDLGAVPIVASMRWNPINDRLYVVDEGQFQVTEIETEPFGILRFFD